MSVLRQWPMYLLGRILPAALTFAGIALYTRLLEPAAFGTYALLTAASLLTGLFSYSWLRVAVLRMLASSSDDDGPDYMATILRSFVISSCIVAIAIVAMLFFTYRTLPVSLYMLTVLATIVANWFELNVTVAQARMKLVSYGLLQGFRAIVGLAVTVVLIKAGLSVAALLGGFAAGNAVAFAFVGVWIPARHGRFRREIFVRLFRFGWSSSLNSVYQIANTTQRILLTVSGGSAALGICTAASGISEKTIGILVGTTALAGQPLTFRAHDLGAREQLRSQMRHNARLIFTVGVGATICIVALSEAITSVFLGAKFRHDAQPIISMAAVTILLASFRTYYFEQIFEIALAMRPIAILIFMRTALTIVLSVLLIPRFGAIGLVASGLIMEVVACTVTAIWARRLLDYPLPLASFFKTIVAAGAMVIAIDAVPNRDNVFGLSVALAAAALSFGAAHAVFYGRQLYSLLKVSHRLQSSGTVL